LQVGKPRAVADRDRYAALAVPLTAVGWFETIPSCISNSPGRWRKRKGIADIRLSDGEVVRAEIHWYEGTGIGRRELKIKRFL